jgi:hypothetical protein
MVLLPLIDMLHSAAIPAEDKSRAIVVTSMLDFVRQLAELRDGECVLVP